MLDKKHYVSIIDILTYQYYLTFSMRSIEVEVKIAQVGLVLSLH